ncbi:hypothetical protein LLG88_13750 [bacterium]|nr:hypothetical protein [bacterium]
MPASRMGSSTIAKSRTPSILAIGHSSSTVMRRAHALRSARQSEAA